MQTRLYLFVDQIIMYETFFNDFFCSMYRISNRIIGFFTAKITSVLLLFISYSTIGGPAVGSDGTENSRLDQREFCIHLYSDIISRNIY